jgi:DNA mismatch endonuclease (patch repair protein)
MFGLGLRYRLHSKNLPGKPDLVLARHRTVVFVNGCFWHGHDCYLFKWPRSNASFWRAKIGRNRTRDRDVRLGLAAAGWRTVTVWECAIRKAAPAKCLQVAETVKRFLASTDSQIVIPSP